MPIQPDFQKLFFTALGGSPRRVSYRVRLDSNFHHDLQFLRSLTNDARINPAEVSLRGQRLRIPLDRDCWEYGMDGPGGRTELRVAQALLRLHPVSTLQWDLPHRQVKEPSSELWLSDIHVASDYWDDPESSWSLVLRGHAWQARIRFSGDEPTIRLDDQEVPYYWSERHCGGAT